MLIVKSEIGDDPGGRGVLTNSLFEARTALLCRHRSGVEMNWTQRMGTLNSFASSTQYARVSSLALVLSGEVRLRRVEVV